GEGSVVQRAERWLGDRVVAALGQPATAIVAAAEVDGQDYAVPRLPFQAGTVGGDHLLECLRGISPTLPHALDPPRVQVGRIGWRVELDVRHALLDEGRDLLADDADQVAEQVCRGGVEPVRDAGPVAIAAELGGTGERDLERP